MDGEVQERLVRNSPEISTQASPSPGAVKRAKEFLAQHSVMGAFWVKVYREKSERGWEQAVVDRTNKRDHAMAVGEVDDALLWEAHLELLERARTAGLTFGLMRY